MEAKLADSTSKSIKYRITCDGKTDILVRLADPSIALPIEEKVNENFVQALNYFCQRFYPSANPKKVPWKTHKSLNELKKRNYKDYIRKINKEKKHIWPLAWYWKLLLPLTSEWDTSKKWYICVSQIRQWVMVSIYEKNSTTVNLLRSPFFGKSDHLLRSDPYWALAMSYNQKKIINAWQSIKRKHKNDDELYIDRSDVEKWYVVGRHDLVYTIVNVSTIDNGIEVELKVELNLEPYNKTIKKEKGLPQVKIKQPYDLIEVPTYKNRQKKHKNASILLASDHMCRALEKASEVWNDNTAKSVLFIAPPGSGKEILSKSLYQFRYIPGEYIVSSLVPGASEYNQKLLYYKEADGNREDPDTKEVIARTNKGDNPLKDYNDEDGLVLRARHGMLFLDEIDKAEKEDLAMLLRFLENQEFAYYGENKIKKLENSCPIVVFAGSKTRSEMFKLEPSDFWTRITHIIELENPFDTDDENEKLRAYCDYFIMFWLEHVPKFFSSDPLNTEYNKEKFLINYYNNIYITLMDDDVVYYLASIFAHECCFKNSTLHIGPRHVRSIVKRTVFSIVDLVIYDKRAFPPLYKASYEYSRNSNRGDRWPELLKWLLGADIKIDIEENIINMFNKLRQDTHVDIVAIITEAIRKVCI